MDIKVLGRTVSIDVVSSKTLKTLSGDDNNLGFFDGTRIYLLATLNKDQKKRILTHEIIHAFLHISGLTNLLDEKLEEAICDSIENLVDSDYQGVLCQLTSSNAKTANKQ